MRGYELVKALREHAADTAREDRAGVMRDAASEIERLITDARRVIELESAGDNLAAWLKHPEVRFKICNGEAGNLGEQAEWHRVMNEWQRVRG